MPARVPVADYTSISPKAKGLWDKQMSDHGRMTEMKKTLAHSDVAFAALMEWYPLYQQVCQAIGELSCLIFAFALSSQTSCLICSTFFRRILIQRGLQPESLELSKREVALVEMAQHLAERSQRVPDKIFNDATAGLNEKDKVNLIAFAGMMIATNMINNALQIPLDDYLQEFRAPGSPVI